MVYICHYFILFKHTNIHTAYANSIYTLMQYVVNSFVELGKKLFRTPGVKAVFSKRFNQDPLESFLGSNTNEEVTVTILLYKISFTESSHYVYKGHQQEETATKPIKISRVISLMMLHFQREKDIQVRENSFVLECQFCQ